MIDYITTYTGLHIKPLAPKAELITIEDIAHALSLLCRGNGHVKTFYSVGQHCIHCALEAEAREYAPRVVLACLLHDASEAYMSDIPSPFKQYLDGYNDLEDKLLSKIYTKFLGADLTDKEAQLVYEIDKDMLYYDLLILLGERLERDKPKINIELEYEPKPFEVVEKKYLELFHKYEKLIK